MRRTALLTVIAAAMVSLVACSDDAGDSASTAGSTADTSAAPASTDADTSSPIDISRVSLKVAINGENTTSLMREPSGAFADAPYDIEWVNIATANESMEALNAGAVDVVAGVQIPAAVLAQANSTEPWNADDAPFKVVAAWEPFDSRGFVLVVPPDSPAQRVTDLVGGRVALSKGSWGQYFWARASIAAGFSDGDVEVVSLPASEGRTAFRAGEVDALVTVYRTGLTLQDEGSARIIASSDEFAPYTTLSLVRREILDDPAATAAITDLMKRLEDEYRWIADNPEVVAKELASVLDLKPATAALAARADTFARVPLDEEVIALLQEVVDTFFSLGVAKSATDVSIIVDRRLDQDSARTT